MGRTSKGKVYTVSIIIQWREEDAELADGDSNNSQFKKSALCQRVKKVAGYSDKKSDSRNKGVVRFGNRLLPSDRVVLDALCAYVPNGKRVTTPVRTRELVAACEISRRQVQICLRRLAEMKIIRRLTKGTSSGNQEGYRYQVSQAMCRRRVSSVAK
jgi:predicted transcriptional regulator